MTGSRATPLFIALAVGIGAVFALPLWQLTQWALEHEQYSHILLIPFVTAYLLFTSRARWMPLQQSSARWGWGLWAAAGLAGVLGLASSEATSTNDHLAILTLAFVLAILGAFAFTFGTGAMRQALFPLLFLFLMVPLPDFMLAGVIRFLLWGSTEITDGLFQLLGVEAFRYGETFVLSKATIIIAEECSGIRSTMALFLTALLAGHLFLKRGWTRTALAIAVVPLAILKNGLRIVTLTVLAIRVDPGFLSGPLHTRGGFVFFGITLLLLGGLLYLLAARERPRTSPRPA